MKTARALIVAAACAFVAPVASVASVDRAPRLWHVSGVDDAGEPTVFYLLGVTHNGLPVEYDAYFRDRVIPAFDTASHYRYENASLTGLKVAPCAQPLVSVHGQAEVEALRARLVDVMTRFHEAVDRRAPQRQRPGPIPWREISEGSVRVMSEFEMMLSLPTYRANLSSLERGPVRQAAAAPREQVAQALARRRPAILAASLDEPQDLVDAYCDSGEGRVAFIHNVIQHDDLIAGPAHASKKEVDEELKQGYRDFTATFTLQRPVGVFASGSQFSESIVCERNAKWVGKMTHPDASGPWFYAVGLAHLFPIAGATASCQGLLDDLRRKGWSVDPVRTRT